MHKLLGERRIEELSHLEAQREVEASPERKRFAEVDNAEIRWINFQDSLIDPRPVEPYDIVYTLLREHRQPGTQPAPNIDHAVWRELIHHVRNKDRR